MNDIFTDFGLAPLGGQTPSTTPRAPVEPAGNQDWREDAACHPKHRPDAVTPRAWTDQFFPPQGTPVAPIRRKFCDRCPVRDDCADEGLTERTGIWGGAGYGARRQLRRVS